MNTPGPASGSLPWRAIVRGVLATIFVAALVCTPLAFAYAYPHCTGAHMTNCGLGPAVVLFGSLLSAGVALVAGALLLLLWQAQPLAPATQLMCKVSTAACAAYLFGFIVMMNL